MHAHLACVWKTILPASAEQNFLLTLPSTIFPSTTCWNAHTTSLQLTLVQPALTCAKIPPMTVVPPMLQHCSPASNVLHGRASQGPKALRGSSHHHGSSDQMRELRTYRDAHAVAAQVAQAQDALPVSQHHHPHIALRLRLHALPHRPLRDRRFLALLRNCHPCECKGTGTCIPGSLLSAPPCRHAQAKAACLSDSAAGSQTA